MDFKQIEAFVNVVRYKSFSRAADATFFTQPTISAHIATLEKELGTKLLDRKGRSVEMTPQGQTFYKYAVEMVNTRAQAVQSIRSGEEELKGILELQTSTIPGIVYLPELLAGFSREHEGVQFYVEMSDSKQAIENLFDRRGEIAFVGEQVAEGNLDYFELFTDRIVLVAPTSMEFGKDVLTVEDILPVPLIWRENGSATRRSFEDAVQAQGYDKNFLRFVAKMNDLTMILRSVEQGLGAAVLSQTTVEACETEGLCVYPIEGFTEKRTFYMAIPRGVFLSPEAEAFKNFVLDRKRTVGTADLV